MKDIQEEKAEMEKMFLISHRIFPAGGKEIFPASRQRFYAEPLRNAASARARIAALS